MQHEDSGSHNSDPNESGEVQFGTIDTADNDALLALAARLRNLADELERLSRQSTADNARVHIGDPVDELTLSFDRGEGDG